MNITEFALALVERHVDLLGAEPELVEDIAARYAEEVGSTTALVAALFEKRGDFATTVGGVCASLRLGSPRLKAIYPGARRRALTETILRHNDALAAILPQVLELALKRELAQAELAEERRRDQEYADAEHARKELGLYVEVIETIDILYSDYGANRRQYACLTDEQHRDIAAIIRREPPETIPIVRRRTRKEKNCD